jgi:hypothetical protein
MPLPLDAPYMKSLEADEERPIERCRWIESDWCMDGSSGPIACQECLTKKCLRARKRRCDLAVVCDRLMKAKSEGIFVRNRENV